MPLSRFRRRRASASESQEQRRRAEEQSNREQRELEDARVDELKRAASAINGRGNEIGFALAMGEARTREAKVLLDADSSANPYVNLTYLRFQYNVRMARGG